jgi:hypothetical protein
VTAVKAVSRQQAAMQRRSCRGLHHVHHFLHTTKVRLHGVTIFSLT